MVGARSRHPRAGSKWRHRVVLAGQDDRVAPPGLARQMHEYVAGSRFQVIPGAGHVACVEQPAAFNAAVLDLIRPYLQPIEADE